MSNTNSNSNTKNLIPMRKISIFLLQALLIFLFFQSSYIITAQTTNKNITDFSCSPVSTSCETFIVYRTQAPWFLDVGNISDLLGVSRRSIMRANNLTSRDVEFYPGQPLLVPILCGCAGNQSFANMTYEIKAGDSFYLVSIHEFENLTNYIVVEASNPMLVPTKLMPGQLVNFPLLCKCPTKSQLDEGVKFLITYVWQDEDNISKVSRMMNSSANAIQSANNYRNFSDAVYRPMLVPVSEPPHLSQLINNVTLPAERKSKSGRTIVVVSVTVAAVLALILLSVMVITYSKRRRKKVFYRAGSSFDTNYLLWFKKPSNIQTLSPKTMVDKLLPSVSQYLDKPVVYDTQAIKEATMNFDERCRIGGSVYRAVLNGQMLAVKRAKGDVTEELKILHTVSHANLVKLAGIASYQTDGDDLLLLYEYAENGSLDQWLYPTASSPCSLGFLSWNQRLSIALDVANGLHYMHEHIRPSIVHSNIRASNILLGVHFKAKVTGFSMAKPATIAVTPAADVLAFGAVLLELLSGKRAVGSEMGFVLEVEDMKKERLRGWMDPKMEGHYPIDGALSLAGLAKACTSEAASERPSTAEIVFSLSVVAQSCSDAFSRQLVVDSEESMVNKNPLAAR